MEFILASGSPRRRQLLEQIGIRNFVVRPTDADESLPDGIGPRAAGGPPSRSPCPGEPRTAPRRRGAGAPPDVFLARGSLCQVVGLCLSSRTGGAHVLFQVRREEPG